MSEARGNVCPTQCGDAWGNVIGLDFSGVSGAWNELTDVHDAFVLLVRNLAVSAPALNREFQARKRWVYLHGPFNATQVQALRSVKGVHLTGDFQRFYPSRDLARPIPQRDGRPPTIEIITDRSGEEALELIRHDAAHVLAESVLELYPGVKISIDNEDPGDGRFLSPGMSVVVKTRIR